MNIHQINQSENIGSQNQNVRLLKEGGQVSVKILSDSGNNKYEAMISGVKVQVSANSGLEAGAVFKAVVASKNGSIQLTPLIKAEILKVETLIVEETMENLFSPVENSQLAGLLSSLGMANDKLSLSIFQQMKQLGMKLSPELMKKIYKDSLKFKGKEKKAAELMVLLKQKGIDYSEEDILALLSDSFTENEKKRNEDKSLGTGLISYKNLVSAFIQNVISTDYSNQKVGVLTIMNHLGWKGDRSGNGSWIFLPFEIMDYSSEEIKGNGNIKLLLDQSKRMKKILLDCKYENREYLFCVEKNGDRSKILFNVEHGDGSQKNIEELKNKLSSEFGSNQNIQIEWVSREKLTGFAGGMEEIAFAQGDI